MNTCVHIDGSGYLVQSVGESFPDCSGFALVTAPYLDRLTYWADLAIELDPSGSAFWQLSAAMIGAWGVVLGLRIAVSYLRTAYRET